MELLLVRQYAVLIALLAFSVDAFAPHPTNSASFGIVHPPKKCLSFKCFDRTPAAKSRTSLQLIPEVMPTESLAVFQQINLSIDQNLAEEIAGPFFGVSFEKTIKMNLFGII